MRDLRRDVVMGDPTENRRRENERWFRSVCKLANEAIREAAITEQRYETTTLREVIETKLIADIREGGQALLRVADYLEAL